MLGSTGGLVGSSGESGSSAHEGNGGGGGEVVGSSSIMSGGIGNEEKGGGGGGIGGDFYEGDRSTGGNRWPRQETLALLKIRFDMDGVFRDSSLKGPLWEEVSRKMADLGYHRSSKKCKEKFENVYKYHKRTKDGRVRKADGKTYRFFDQLEALEQHHSSPHLPPLPPGTPRGQQSQPPAQAAVPITMVMPATGANQVGGGVTVSSSPHPVSVVHTSCITPVQQQVQVQHHQMNVTTHHIPQAQPQPHVMQHLQNQHHQAMQVHHSSPIQMENASSPSATPSSSSSTSSDEEFLGRRKRKRKWKDFFERLMKEVIDKQENLQKRFLDAVEKREHDRLAREESWKMQEMARLNREHEILVQERSMAASKDAALIAILQKLSDQQQIPLQLPVQVQLQAQTQPQTHVHVQNAVPVVTTTATQPQPQPLAQPVSVLQTPPPQPQPQAQPQPQPQPQPPKHQVSQVHVQEIPVSLPTQTQPIAIPLPPQPQPITQMPPRAAQQQQALVIANAKLDLYKANNGGGGEGLQASSSRWPKAEVQALIQLRTNLDQKYQESGPKGPLWEEISASMKKLGYNRNAKRCKEKWENINKYFKKVKESNKKRPEDSKTCPYFHQLDALYREKSKGDISISPGGNPAYNQNLKPENLNTMGPIMAQPEQQWHVQQGQDHGMEEDHGNDNDDSDDDGEEEEEDDDDDQGSGYEIVANNSNNNNGGNSISTSTTATATAD